MTTANVVFMAPVSVRHIALTSFIDQPELFRCRNMGFASACHNLSSIIIVKQSKYKYLFRLRI